VCDSEQSSFFEGDSSMYSALANQIIEEGNNEFDSKQSLIEAIKA